MQNLYTKLFVYEDNRAQE